MARAASDKKTRLAAAAADLFHRQGLTSTSLADVAHHAEVAPGNVFYHFRSKNDLAAAVANIWLGRVDAMLGELEGDPDPWARLSAFIAGANGRRSEYAAAGCPLAALNRDVRQPGAELAASVSAAYERQLIWLADQFATGGLNDHAADGAARFLLSTTQGSYTLGHALNDESLIGAVLDQLDHWLAGVRVAA